MIAIPLTTNVGGRAVGEAEVEPETEAEVVMITDDSMMAPPGVEEVESAV